MNKMRREQIQQIIRKLEDLLENILDDERDAYENMPENFQQSQRGLNSEEAQESLEGAIDALEEAIACLEEIE